MSVIDQILKQSNEINSIFIRYDNDRIDCMRTIIFGCPNTPYAHGAFLYDMYFDDENLQIPL